MSYFIRTLRKGTEPMWRNPKPTSISIYSSKKLKLSENNLAFLYFRTEIKSFFYSLIIIIKNLKDLFNSINFILVFINILDNSINLLEVHKVYVFLKKH